MENIIRIADDFAKQHKLALPLRLDTMRHLCDALGYKLLTYAEGAPILEKLSFEDYMHCPAFCTRVMDCNVVFYDDTCSVGHTKSGISCCGISQPAHSGMTHLILPRSVRRMPLPTLCSRRSMRCAQRASAPSNRSSG